MRWWQFNHKLIFPPYRLTCSRVNWPHKGHFISYYSPAEIIRVMRNGTFFVTAPGQTGGAAPRRGDGRISCTGLAEQSRGMWRQSKDGTKETEKRRRRWGTRDIITARGMCHHPQGLLLIASLTRLWDVLVGYWIWIQLCRLGGAGISARQTTARFDVDLLSLLPATAACFPLEVPPPHPPPYQKWPGCDGLASCECQTALWLFNEAIRRREPPPPLPPVLLK